MNYIAIYVNKLIPLFTNYVLMENTLRPKDKVLLVSIKRLKRIMILTHSGFPNFGVHSHMYE